MSNIWSPKNPKMFPQPLRGIADREIAYGLPGRVKCQGVYWSAKLYQPEQHVFISPGEWVNVIAIDGITLLVIPTGT